MPQEFYCLRCFKCNFFQVEIVKKVPKWTCKICGEKQSVQYIYGQGISKDCRLHVQKLNQFRSKLEEAALEDSDKVDKVAEPFENNLRFVNHENEVSQQMFKESSSRKLENFNKQSKWLEFLSDQEEDDEIADNHTPEISKNKRNGQFSTTQRIKKSRNVNSENFDKSENNIFSINSESSQIENTQAKQISDFNNEVSSSSKWSEFYEIETGDDKIN